MRKNELIVALLAAVACLISYPGLGIPVWTVFIGWAWYFAMGASPACLKKIYPAILPGAINSVIAIFIITYLVSKELALIPAMMIGALVTAWILMVCLRFLDPAAGFIAFHAYASLFAVFYGKASPMTGNFFGDVAMAFLFSVAGNAVGPIFGYLSVTLSSSKKDKSASI